MAEDTTESEEKPKLTFSKYGDEARRNDFELFLPRPKKTERKPKKSDLMNFQFERIIEDGLSAEQGDHLKVAGKHLKIKKEIADQFKQKEKETDAGRDDKDTDENEKHNDEKEGNADKTPVPSPPQPVTLKVPEKCEKRIDPLERHVNYHMTLQRLSKSGICKHEQNVEHSRLRKSLGFKPHFNEFLGSTGKLFNEVETPNQVQRLHAKAKASDDLDEEALHNVMITQSTKLKVTSGEHDILIGSLRNRHDREIIQQVARVKTMLRIVDEVMTESL